jgi:hypothetical protein
LFDGFYGVGMKTHDRSGQVERLLSYYRDPIGRLNAQGRSANLNFR